MVRAYFNGRLFTSTGDAAAGSHTVYTDHLGTPRLKLHVTTAASQARDDYYPFGQQVNTVVDAAHDRRFTGKERDAESGLDYFGARYYHSVAGRFLSVDPVLDSADPTNPQSWNRYTYTFNNPLKYVDPDGREVRVAGEMALGLILATLPDYLQSHITAENGVLSVASVTNDNANFLALAELVSSNLIFEVAVAPSAPGVDSLDNVGLKGLSQEPGLEGNLSPNFIVTINDGSMGQSRTERIVTMAHELYGHALLFSQNRPWTHPIKDVDDHIKKVQARTYATIGANIFRQLVRRQLPKLLQGDRWLLQRNQRVCENERAYESRIPFR